MFQGRCPQNKHISHFTNLALSAAKNSQNNFLDNFWYLHEWMGAATHTSRTEWKSKNYSHTAFKYSPESTRIYALMNDISKGLNHPFWSTISITQKQGVQNREFSSPPEKASVILLCQRFEQGKLEQSKSLSQNKENLPWPIRKHCPSIIYTLIDRSWELSHDNKADVKKLLKCFLALLEQHEISVNTQVGKCRAWRDFWTAQKLVLITNLFLTHLFEQGTENLGLGTDADPGS